jgi:hypothetical protein
MKQQSQQVGELERLVLDQHTMIESIQQRCHHSENQEELLMAAQEQLKTISAENVKWQSKFERLEDDSKYLANQIDELLPQLSLKNAKILQLENQIADFELKTEPTLVDCGCQTEKQDKPPISDQPEAPPTPFFCLHDPVIEKALVPVVSERIQMNSLSAQTDPMPREDSHSPPPEEIQRRPRKSKSHSIHQEKHSTKSRAAKPQATVPVETPRVAESLTSSNDLRAPFRPTSRHFEVSQDTDIYNQSFEIYGSSLFDIVERMEGLETTFRSTSSSGGRRR